MSDKKLSTESYKGVRDFYPEDYFVLNYIFTTWQRVAEQFGYLRYDASILEPAELYRAKSGEEIVNNETYTFTDRGEREVTLRPEMTPTVARMVAARRHELAFPLRWYSIPNLFRYEKPQRGRLREHWQLNVDLFGSTGILGDVEIITIADRIMRAFGATDSDFIIKINDRRIMNDLYTAFDLDEENKHKVAKIIDKKEKIPAETFVAALTEVMGEKAAEFTNLLSSTERLLEKLGPHNTHTRELILLIERLQAAGIPNIVFDPTLMRGFDYYTGTIFEVFDQHPDNRRSVFGGGRYDDLVDLFGVPKVSAIGFGAGDVTIRDFLEVHNFMPTYRPTTDLYIAVHNNEVREAAENLADELRRDGIRVALDLSDKKVGDQIKSAHKQMIPFVLVVGEDEVKSGLYPLKNMHTGEEQKITPASIAALISNTQLPA